MGFTAQLPTKGNQTVRIITQHVLGLCLHDELISSTAARDPALWFISLYPKRG
jgi:hypothetical protein